MTAVSARARRKPGLLGFKGQVQRHLDQARTSQRALNEA
jgi:hypothetical protein